MIRDAKFTDVAEMQAMLSEMYAASKYQGRVEIDQKAARELLMAAVMSQGKRSAQASFVAVAEHDGKLTGFMIGVLDRVYHIGKLLTANDLFLHCRPTARATDALRLIDAYIAWARGNQRVIEIMLSWSDTLPGAERIASVYERKGAAKSGEMYEIRLDVPEEREAA